jgi:uncharacterized lipoprotein YehR (DUF1307 family)
MKTLLVAFVIALSLTACGEPDAKRVEVKKELKDFTEQCKANPQAPECVAHKASTQGGG